MWKFLFYYFIKMSADIWYRNLKFNCSSTSLETPKEKFDRRINKVLTDANDAWVKTFIDDYEERIQLLEGSLKQKDRLLRNLENEKKWFEAMNLELNDKINFLSCQNSRKTTQIAALKKWIVGDISQITLEFPWWNEKTWEQQMDIFVDLLKSENLLSVKESEDFYDVFIVLPYWDYKLHFTKKEFDLNCNRDDPKCDYAKITNLDWDFMKRWFHRIMEEDAENLSQNLLFLFDKLWKNNVYEEAWDYIWMLVWRKNGEVNIKDLEENLWRIWSFFWMFINSVLKEFTKTTYVWFGNSYNINSYDCNSSAITFPSYYDHKTLLGAKSIENFELCRVLYIEK